MDKSVEEETLASYLRDYQKSLILNPENLVKICIKIIKTIYLCEWVCSPIGGVTQKIDSATWVQILDEAVSSFYH